MTRPAPLELDAKPEVAAAPIAAPALAYVGIGGNLGDRATILGSAVDVFARGWIPGTRLLRCSPAFETRPLGPSRFPFLNAALELATTLTPIELLDALLTIERSHGRTRRASSRWGARTLDLDLLVYLPHATAREDDAVPVAAGSLTVSSGREARATRASSASSIAPRRSPIPWRTTATRSRASSPSSSLFTSTKPGRTVSLYLR